MCGSKTIPNVPVAKPSCRQKLAAGMSSDRPFVSQKRLKSCSTLQLHNAPKPGHRTTTATAPLINNSKETQCLSNPGKYRLMIWRLMAKGTSGTPFISR